MADTPLIQKASKRPIWRRFIEFLVAGGLVTTAFATAGRIVEIWAEDDSGRICENAHAAMRDDN